MPATQPIEQAINLHGYRRRGGRGPIGSLARGHPGLLLLTVTNPATGADASTVTVTAAFAYRMA